MDEVQAAAFQFAGQDIPWLLRSWAESQPDKTFLDLGATGRRRPRTGPTRSSGTTFAASPPVWPAAA